jgi:hypothetical protein
MVLKFFKTIFSNVFQVFNDGAFFSRIRENILSLTKVAIKTAQINTIFILFHYIEKNIIDLTLQR